MKIEDFIRELKNNPDKEFKRDNAIRLECEIIITQDGYLRRKESERYRILNLTANMLSRLGDERQIEIIKGKWYIED